ncbi:MAG: VOC family protein [Gemmatimonadaceae bacterium]
MTTESKPDAAADTTATVSRGRFVWYDLMTTDVPAATAFYTAIAGWGTQDFEMGNGKYQMWTVGDAPIGGVMDLQQQQGAPPMPPHWMAHVAVPDVDDTVKQAESLGASVHVPPTDIPTVGRFAVIADPQGAAIAVFTPSQAQASTPFAPKIGEFSWHELMTTDHKAAFDFYSKLFGWEKQQTMDMGAMGEYLMFGQGAMYGGMMTLTPDMKMPPNWSYYIHVESADASVEKVKSLGGQVLNGPMEVPGGDRIAQCMDPQGGMFAVHSTKQS